VLGVTLAELVDQLAARTSAPGAGAVAAVSATLAAGLATMAARFDDDDAAVEQCEELRRRAEPLAVADGEAYGSYLTAVRRPRDDPGRAAAVADARDHAVAVPLEIAAVAVEVAEIAARLAREGNPRLRGDAVTAAVIAAAASRSAAVLIELNLGDHDDPHVGRARELAHQAHTAADAATAPD